MPNGSWDVVLWCAQDSLMSLRLPEPLVKAHATLCPACMLSWAVTRLASSMDVRNLVPSSHWCLTQSISKHSPILVKKNGNIQSGILLSCESCLKKQTIGQTTKQLHYLEQEPQWSPQIPSILESGRYILGNNGKLDVSWMTGSHAPYAVLEFLSCKGERVCQLLYGTCLTNGIKCTDVVVAMTVIMVFPGYDFRKIYDEFSVY